ncbi:hypothetical protein ACIQK6_13715 [Streptomyces sp. NPDC091682]|uniref:hypothetical protein n=1 Tax=Streptomyces sp. NPDC091682 TaxID=3366005 RepID=UPI003809144F
MTLTDPDMTTRTYYSPGDVPGPSGRRQERRLDRREDRQQDREDKRETREQDREDRRAAAAQKRLDIETEEARRAARKEAAAAARTARREGRRKAWADRRAAFHTAVTAHMPATGIPVVAVSLAMGATGQIDAAQHQGMGFWSLGVPVLTEGMTLTLATLTAAALAAGQPHRFLLRATWASALFAAGVNAYGHYAEAPGAAGLYRALIFAVASLAGLVMWAIILRRQRQARGDDASTLARRRRLTRRFPLIAAQARLHRDVTGCSWEEGWETAWERRHGAPTHELSIRDIRRERRTAHKRREAEAWDGRRRLDRFRGVDAAGVEVVDAEVVDDVEEALDVEPEPVLDVAPAPAPEVTAGPAFLPSTLLVPTGRYGWAERPVPALPATGSQTPMEPAPEPPTTRFPQGRGPLPELPREAVADERLEAVRSMVTAVVAKGGNLLREPSVRAVRKHLSCRSETASELLDVALAEHGVKRSGTA